MSKHGYWLEQFNYALPIFIAERWVVNNIDRIEKECEHLGVEHLVSFIGASYAKPQVGKWAVRHGGFVQRALLELRNSEGEMGEQFFAQLTQSKYDRAHPKLAHEDPGHPYFDKNSVWSWLLADKMEVCLGEAIVKTDWWKDNLPEIRKRCANVLKVKKVMES